jgi:tRNA(Ile)-lysidine synthase
VQSLPQSALAYVRKHALLKAGDRVGIAVSGGLDSVAVLRLLLELRKELGVVLSVVHFNHKLRGADSDGDEQFVAELARGNKLEFHCESADVSGSAAEQHLSLETAAREARYKFFERLLRENRMNRIATAHTLDDQAETVLLKIVRGAGTRGLAGIYPQLSVDGSRFSVIRPLLGTRRRELQTYLQGLGQEWREDKSNRDLRHARNRVRHGILPRLERNLNPAVREALAETAEIARVEEAYWQEHVAKIVNSSKPAINLRVLGELPLALRRRVVRAVAESLGVRLEFRHVEEILDMSSGQSATLPKGWTAAQKKEELRFDPPHEALARDYQYELCVPGAVEVPEAGSRFEAMLVPGKASAAYNPEHLLDRDLLSEKLQLRNWRAGDRFWPPHAKSAKKIKELLQERHVTGVERQPWPVIVSGDEIVWLRGFATPIRYRPQSEAKQAVLIREVSLKD